MQQSSHQHFHNFLELVLVVSDVFTGKFAEGLLVGMSIPVELRAAREIWLKANVVVFPQEVYHPLMHLLSLLGDNDVGMSRCDRVGSGAGRERRHERSVRLRGIATPP